MKILIFSVWLLVCLQFCSGGSSCGCCEAELAKLRANAKSFISSIFTTTQGTQGTVFATFKKCDKQFNDEQNFLGQKKCGETFEGARCQLRTFAGGYNSTAADFSTKFKSIEADGCASNGLCIEFGKNNDLTCRRQIFDTPCEAELNKLKCELSGFITEIQKLITVNKSHLKRLNCALANCAKLAKEFEETLSKPSCGCKQPTLSELQTKSTDFFTALNGEHWTGHLQMVNVQYNTDLVQKTIKLVYDKLNCV